MRRLPLLLIALLAALAVGLAGCSGGDDDGGTPEPDAAAEAAYLAAIAPTFTNGVVDDEDRWLANGRIVCGTSDASLAETRTEDIARDNERTVRTAAAVEHLCPDRQPVIDDPAAYLEE